MANEVIVRTENKNTYITKAVLAIVVGVMFCCSLLSSTQTLSIIFGIVFIMCGTTLIVGAIINKVSLLTTAGLLSSAFIAFGIFAIFQDIINLVLSIIPWILIALGIVALVDSLLLAFSRKDSSKTGLFVLELTLGIILIVLGICLKVITGFTKFSGIIFGGALIAYGIVCLVTMNKKKK